MILYGVTLSLRNPDVSGERMSTTVYAVERSKQSAVNAAVDLVDEWYYMNGAIIERIEPIGIMRAPVERGVVFPDDLPAACVGLVLPGDTAVADPALFADMLTERADCLLVPGDAPPFRRTLAGGAGVALAFVVLAYSLVAILGRWEGRW